MLPRLTPWLRFAARMVFFVVTIGCASAAWAANIVVDGVACTLREAIIAANTNTTFGGCRAGNDRHSSDTIQLESDVVLSDIDNFDADGCANGLPAITSDIT